jgi:H-NS histone family
VTVKTWQYKKLALNEGPRKGDDIDLLCDAGEDEWELVTVLPNGIAFLKREIDQDETAEREEASPREEPIAVRPREEPADNGVVATVTRGSEVKAKYRDPVTGDTWSGRGRMASWLKRKQEAGEDIEKYLV